MIRLAQAATDLTATPTPVLFLDTCALLDIIRATLRDHTATVRAAVTFRALAAAGAVRLFVQDIVPGEWAENRPSARRDGEAGVQAYLATCQVATELGLLALPLPVFSPATLLDSLELLSRDLLAAADVLDRDHDGMSWAIDRVAAKRKPSSAKGVVKDSHILGHALRLCSLLGSAYPKSWVLVSSNKTDFAASPAVAFHPDIAAEAGAAGLKYAVSLETALADLRAAGEIP